MNTTYRKAKESDLTAIINLLIEDDLGFTRENTDKTAYKKYAEAFHKINDDPNQYLMVVELNNKIVASSHLTLIPSLTFCGSTRMQIEAVRVHKSYRNQKIGKQMINEAIRYAQTQGATIIQLTTNNQRNKSIEFYKKVGFKQTHIGFKKYLNKDHNI